MKRETEERILPGDIVAYALQFHGRELQNKLGIVVARFNEKLGYGEDSIVVIWGRDDHVGIRVHFESSLHKLTSDAIYACEDDGAGTQAG